MTKALTIGFLPLVDAALPILAQEHGFAEEEGLALSFVRDVSWATVLDRLLYGHSDAAHMLAPLAIATTLGRGRPARAMSAPFALGLNGNAVTVTPKLAAEILPGGGLGRPAELGKALKSAICRRDKRLRFGVVHRYSSHNYKLRYWLAACGIRPGEDIEIVTLAPPFAADALANGDVDGICVGEPWNSAAVERGVGQIVLVTSQIWRRGVEKLLAMPTDRLEQRRDDFEALIRAMHKAAAHFVEPKNWDANARILAGSEYLDCPSELVRRAISDRIVLAQGDAPTHIPDFMFQYREAANFPWASQAGWLYSQLLRWDELGFSKADFEMAMAVFRPDIYRSALAGSQAPLPIADAKREGAIVSQQTVDTISGELTLSPDPFFDGRSFEISEISEYLVANN